MSDTPPPPEPPSWNTAPPPPPPDFLAPPPGYVAYGDPGSVPQGIARIGGLSKAMVILLAIMAPLQVIGLFDTIGSISDARDFLEGTISRDEFRDRTTTGIGGLGGILVLPVAVLTMIWMFRMAKNLRGALGRQGTTWAPGWAIGGWFVPPIVLYVVPWLMFIELWKGSDPDRQAHDPEWKTSKVSPLIHVWWVLYGLVPILGLFTAADMVNQFGSFDEVDLAERLDKWAGVTVVLSIISIVTTVVYLVLVRQLSARHMHATRER